MLKLKLTFFVVVFVFKYTLILCYITFSFTNTQ